jgi:hypothetical protein
MHMPWPQPRNTHTVQHGVRLQLQQVTRFGTPSNTLPGRPYYALRRPPSASAVILELQPQGDRKSKIIAT